MPIIIDPVTQQRVLKMNNSGDITYDLDINAGSAIAMETVPLLGNWEDYTGSDITVNLENQQKYGGAENQFDGTRVGIQGENLDRLNEVGQSASTTRRRLIKKYAC